MTTKTKKKLCWNCEGNVSLENETCPYCGVSLDVSPMAGTNFDPITFASPFKPTPSSSLSMIPKAPYVNKSETADSDEREASNDEEQDFVFTDLHRTLLILLLLSIGNVLVIFGIVLLLFSDNQGIFTLHWHGSYWYFYLLTGIPLLYFGWNETRKLQNTSEKLANSKEDL
jgi:hypothetical protein